jgi:hypothetical protein
MSEIILSCSYATFVLDLIYKFPLCSAKSLVYLPSQIILLKVTLQSAHTPHLQVLCIPFRTVLTYHKASQCL